MSDGSLIEWTDATWNPITGCSVVSPGCKHCYAMKLAGGRLQHHPTREGLTQPSKAGPVWTGEVRFNESMLLDPLHWRRPRKIFVCAHGDLFAEGVPREWQDRVFAVMLKAHWHTYQVLTKRAAAMREYVTELKESARWLQFGDPFHGGEIFDAAMATFDAVFAHIWLGVSAEDQGRAEERIPALLDTPAAKRFVSLEPLLGPIDLEMLCTGWYFVEALNGYKYHDVDNSPTQPTGRLDWVIVGGESGRDARPMSVDWARSLREQCKRAGTPFFFKQWGNWIDADHWHDLVGGGPLLSGAERPVRPLNFGDAAMLAFDMACQHHSDGSSSIMVGKKMAGRMLDGVVHDGFPEFRTAGAVPAERGV